MKYAILSISGSQYRISENDTISIDQLDGKEGDTFTSDQVLLAVNGQDTKVGKPYVSGASVEYQIAKSYQGKKLRVFKYKAKSRYHKTQGFRPQLTDIKITKIIFP